jgi:DNA-binding transcriptional LysR family regulator
MSPPAITRFVAQLEGHLGVKLLLRTTRSVKPTTAGLEYAQYSKRILADIETANVAVSGLRDNPAGTLRITAPILFGQMFVTPSIVRYLEQFPDVDVDADFLDRVVNLVDEGLDVAVRIGHLPDSTMRAVKVGQVRIITCASPTYLRENGMPQSLKDLDKHTLINSEALNPGREWRFQENGKETSYKVTPRLAFTSNGAVIEAVKAGFGIARLISYQVAPSLKDGSIKTVLEASQLPAMPVHILHREDRLTSAKVRRFIDVLAEDLKADPSLN